MKIELSNHDAIILASFHNKFLNALKKDEHFIALKMAMNNYMDEVVKNLPPDGLEDAKAEVEVNILLGRSPDRPNRNS